MQLHKRAEKIAVMLMERGHLQDGDHVALVYPPGEEVGRDGRVRGALLLALRSGGLATSAHSLWWGRWCVLSDRGRKSEVILRASVSTCFVMYLR